MTNDRQASASRSPGVRRGRRDFASITGGGLVVQLMTVVSGPLVARMLGPDGRGHMVMVTVITLLCSFLGSAGLPAAIAHTVAAAGVPARDAVGPYLRTWALWSVVPAVTAVGLTFLLMRGAPGLPWLAAAAFTVTLFATWLALLAGLLQGEGIAKHVNALRLFGLLAYVVAVAVIFLIHKTDQAAVLLFVYAGAQVVALVTGWSRLQRPLGDPSLTVPRSEVHGFAKRSFVSGVSVLDGLGFDHLLVGLILGDAALGLYAVAISVTNLPTIVLSGIAAILLPRMAAAPAGQAALLLRRWVLGALAIDLALVVGLEAVIGPAIRIAFGQEFEPAVGAARLLILAWALLAFRRVLTSAAQAQGRAGAASAIELVAAVVLVGGDVLGMQIVAGGIHAAALAMLAAGAVSCVLLGLVVDWRAAGSHEDGEDSTGIADKKAADVDDVEISLP